MFNILAKSMLTASRQNLRDYSLEHPQTPIHAAEDPGFEKRPNEARTRLVWR